MARRLATFRYLGPGGADFDGIPVERFALGHLPHGSVDALWQPLRALQITVKAGADHDTGSGPGRYQVGPGLALLRLLGSIGGGALGYREELGWLPGRQAYAQLHIAAGQPVRLMARATYLEDREQLVTGDGTHRAFSIWGHAEARITRYLALRASALGRVALDPVEEGGRRPPLRGDGAGRPHWRVLARTGSIDPQGRRHARAGRAAARPSPARRRRPARGQAEPGQRCPLADPEEAARARARQVLLALGRLRRDASAEGLADRPRGWHPAPAPPTSRTQAAASSSPGWGGDPLHAAAAVLGEPPAYPRSGQRTGLAAGPGMGSMSSRFEILRSLAVGGMAEIFLARAVGISGFQKLVALKRVHPRYVDNAEIRAMLLDEARLAGQLQHPHIAAVYDVCLDEDGGYVLVMEHVPGKNLGEIRRALATQGDRLFLNEALALAIATAGALHAAHEWRGPDGQRLEIIHRDVSPSNVMVTHGGFVKLIDFGIAKALGRDTKTNPGTLKGKYAYMSPEQASGRPLDRRSDVFSLGILLYEITTGTRLFSGASDLERLRRVISAEVTPPSRLLPGYPERLEEIVMRALRRDPDARYQTAQALQRDLEELARSERLDVSVGSLESLMCRLFGEPDPLVTPAEQPMESLALASLTGLAFEEPSSAPPLAGPVPAAPPAIPVEDRAVERSRDRGDATVRTTSCPESPAPVPRRARWRRPAVIGVSALCAAVALVVVRGPDDPAVIAKASAASADPPAIVVPPAPVPPVAAAPAPAAPALAFEAEVVVRDRRRHRPAPAPEAADLPAAAPTDAPVATPAPLDEDEVDLEPAPRAAPDRLAVAASVPAPDEAPSASAVEASEGTGAGD